MTPHVKVDSLECPLFVKLDKIHPLDEKKRCVENYITGPTPLTRDSADPERICVWTGVDHHQRSAYLGQGPQRE